MIDQCKIHNVMLCIAWKTEGIYSTARFLVFVFKWLDKVE